MDTDTAPAATAESPLRSSLVPLAAAVGGGALAGWLTSHGQGALPDALAPLANSAGSWSVLAFLLAMLSPRPLAAAAAGALALAAMVLGYNLASGNFVSVPMTGFWLAAAVVVGPVLGWGANGVRRRTRLAPWAVGAVSGVLVGEGVYGLVVISDTTPPAYWAGSIAAGLALLAWACVRRFAGPRAVLLSAAITAVTAAAFVAAYWGVPYLLLAGVP
ncbi:hypothetical protein GCM10027570_15710 [Streptomonospora sediminis]